MSDPSFSTCHKFASQPYPFPVRKSSNANILSCSALSFIDRVVVQIALNGEIDTTYALQLPAQANFQTQQIISADLQSVASMINSTCLIGSANLKLQVMVNELGKLFVTSGVNKDVIVSMSSKLWPVSEGMENNEFEKLLFVLGLVKECLSFQ